jgi:hypothetical protein
MLQRASLGSLGLALVVTIAAAQAACGGGGGSGGSSTSSGHGGSTSSSSTSTGPMGGGGAGGSLFTSSSNGMSGTGGQMQGFDVQPAALQTITVAAGQQSPTIQYTATLNGNPISAGWGVDHGNIGTVPAGPSETAMFTPTGTTGGLVAVKAGLNGMTLDRQVFVQLTMAQNGADPANPATTSQIATNPAQLTAGGGIGGVGGEGLGPAVSDPATLSALGAPAGDGSAQGLALLYPYDKTVWPRGLLAPLLQWDWSLGDADAIQIELATTSGSFSYKGTFARPAILTQTGKPFLRHPIPQDVWSAATNTAGGQTPNNMPDKLVLKLTVAKGGMAYGPISQTWTVAPARLSGIIYYNSYGTQLAKNLGGAVGGDKMFGGAVLSIHVGDTGPQLVAGSNGTSAQCRVCHSVAANGSRLIAQHGDVTSVSSDYDLTPMGATEHQLPIGAVYPAISPDGATELTPSGQLLPLPAGTPAIPVTGLSSVTTNLGTPTFSPDGKLVSFNPMNTVANATQKLLVMDFDAATNTFSNAVTVFDATGQNAQTRPGWPAFFPDGKSVVFHLQSAAGIDGNSLGDLRTRKGAKAQIAWTGAAAPNVTVLNQLNGLDAMGNSYLPKLAQGINLSCTGDGYQVGNIDPTHSDDVNYNYEPTVNPVASGGYAWVVFTSRRLYGSVANIPPYCSDPRGVDLVQNITPKKLWVAAVDLSGTPGADASHPAFYLPGQELLAGNSRGFWVLDPCKADGEGCQSGDQCCNGFCEPDSNNNLVCSNMNPNSSCSMPQEKCTTAADCCDPTNICINGFCAQKNPG